MPVQVSHFERPSLQSWETRSGHGARAPPSAEVHPPPSFLLLFQFFEIAPRFMKTDSTMCIGSLINELAFPRPDPQWGAEHLQAHPGLVQLVTSENEGIPAVHIKHPGAFFTVLYSHGNAEDVSISLDYLHDMAAALQCNIFAYEYVGYSLRCATHGDAARVGHPATSRASIASHAVCALTHACILRSALQGNTPSQRGCFRAIEAAWRYLVVTKAIPASQIVIWGRSIGSGPTLHLASQRAVRLPRGMQTSCGACAGRTLSCELHGPSACAGVVVQSGIESAFRVALSRWMSIACFPLDIFRNYRAMPRVQCPCAIMHGSDDEVVATRAHTHTHTHIQEDMPSRCRTRTCGE